MQNLFLFLLVSLAGTENAILRRHLRKVLSTLMLVYSRYGNRDHKNANNTKRKFTNYDYHLQKVLHKI